MFWKKKKVEEKKEMTFLDHLDVLRFHLIKGISAVGIIGVLAFIYKEVIFDYILLNPKNPNFISNQLFCKLAELLNSPAICINQRDLKIINYELSGQFSTHIVVSVFSGVIIAFPYILWELWQFIKPALYDNERKASRGGVFFISVLFFIGIMFGYFIIAPISIEFLGGYQVSKQVDNMVNLDSYITALASTVLACGVVFELPILMLFLSRIGLVTPEFLRRYRKHAFVVILIIAAIITPPDVFSQTIVTIPLYILYEASIFISKSVWKKKNKIVKMES